MAATASRFTPTRATGTSRCWPADSTQATSGYPTRVYR